MTTIRKAVTDTLNRWGVRHTVWISEEGHHHWDVSGFGRLAWNPEDADLLSILNGQEARVRVGALDGWAMAARFEQARRASVTTRRAP